MLMQLFCTLRLVECLFDGTGNALDFLNTIEARNRTRSNDYQRIIIVELSVQAAAYDWFMQSIRPFMSSMTWLEFKEQFLRFYVHLLPERTTGGSGCT